MKRFLLGSFLAIFALTACAQTQTTPQVVTTPPETAPSATPVGDSTPPATASPAAPAATVPAPPHYTYSECHVDGPSSKVIAI